MTLKLLTDHHLEFLSLKGGCTGSSVSTHVKMPHCWKSHVTAHLYLLGKYQNLLKCKILSLSFAGIPSDVGTSPSAILGKH